MEHRTLMLSNDVVFRKVKDELITIHTGTGEFHYFTADAESFLTFFRRPASTEKFFEAAGISTANAENDLVREQLVGLLLTTIELGILLNADEQVATDANVHAKVDLRRPAYLRRGEKNLDDVTFAFLYP